MISHTKQEGDLLRALGSAFCNITHETGGMISYRHCVLYLAISHTRQRVRFVAGIGIGSSSGDITHDTVGTICYNHRRDRGYDLLRTLCSATCDILHDTGGAICCRHCVLPLEITHTRHGVRFVTGMGFCI